MLSQGRGGASLVTSACGRYLHVMGGFTGKEDNEVHSFSLETHTWDCPRCPAHTLGGSGMPFRSGCRPVPIVLVMRHKHSQMLIRSLLSLLPATEQPVHGSAELCLHDWQFSSFAGVCLAPQRMPAALVVPMPITSCCLGARLSLVTLGITELGVFPMPPFVGIRCVHIER